MAAKPSPQTLRPKAKKKRSSWKRRLLFGVAILCIGAILTGAVGYFIFYPHLVWAQQAILKLDTVTIGEQAEPTIIISADGKTLYRSISRFQKPVKFPDIPKIVRDTTLAAEDERFYEHGGVDYRAAFRALFTNVVERRQAQGASTITMQIAKAMTGSDKTFDRKLKNIALAMEMENRHTKDEILKLYVNNSYYGAGAYGIAAAADIYFGKTLSQLTLAEAALLSRMVQRPSDYNPFNNPEVALEKRNVVLAKMRELKWCSEEDYQTAIHEPLKLRKTHERAGERILGSPYFVNYILDTVRRTHPEIDLSKGGYRVETTLNTRLQALADKAVKRVVRNNRRAGLTTAAFVCMDYQGKLLAMVGGVDYSRTQYNVIYQGRRQPGSAMKPFVAAAALTTGAIGYYDSISNEPHYIIDHGRRRLWPKGGGKGGSVSIRSTIANSINVPSVRIIEKVGPQTAANYCRDVFGFSSPLAPVPSLVLGSSAVSPLELAQGYSVFMLNGDRATPFGIVRIIAPDGSVIDDFGPKVVENILDPAVCDFMDGCLRAVVTSGSATKASVIPNARGKTGTTQDNRDAWFCGYTNNLVGIGWVANERVVNGRAEYRVMPGVFGGKVTVDIWVDFMEGALGQYDDSATHFKSGHRPAPTVEADSERIDTSPPDEDPGAGAPIEDPFPESVPPIETDPGAGKPKPNNDPGTKPEQGNPPAPHNEKPTPRTNPNESETIAVEICVETGMKATPYCPETVTRRVPRGGIPPSCRSHGPRGQRR